MRKHILSWKAYFGFSVLLAAIVGVQFLTNVVILDNTYKWTGACAFTEWEYTNDFPEGKRINMKLMCDDGDEGSIDEKKVIVSYLQNPGPLTCKRYNTDSVLCEERKQEKEAS